MKTMFVTGATKNTGFAIARKFASEGWNVCLSSRDGKAADAAAAKLGAEFPGVGTLGLGMDPADVLSVRAAFGRIGERFGRLDAFVSNAANLGVGLSILSTTPEDYDAVMNANVRAAFFGAQEAVKLMKDGGAVTVISSCHAKRSVPGRICYTVSKAALGGMVRSLAVELGPLGIRANAILAGAIRTDRWEGLTEAEVQERRDRYPAGRESSPEDIAEAVFFLSGDAARTITGVEMPVDSGVGVCLLKYNKDWMRNDPYNVKYWEKKGTGIRDRGSEGMRHEQGR